MVSYSDIKELRVLMEAAYDNGSVNIQLYNKCLQIVKNLEKDVVKYEH